MAVALTPFVGMTADEVAGAGERPGKTCTPGSTAGPTSSAAGAWPPSPGPSWPTEGCQPGCSPGPSGERELTDLGHVAELLHAEARPARWGARPAGLAGSPDRRGPEVETAEAEDRSRRLDSDADAVQVLTIHRAKGLEFPVVYCPYLWDTGPALRNRAARGLPRPDADRAPSTSAPPTAAELRITRDRPRRTAREDLRLLYVALTRARHQVVIWWAGPRVPQHSPLGRLLMCRRPSRQRGGPAASTHQGRRRPRASSKRSPRRAPG